MSDREKILILGGTKEAAELAAGLVAQGHDVTTSLAGRTREPAPVAGKTRIGGFGGAAGLADYLRRENFTRLIDATHPFARQISINAAEAAGRTGVKFEQHTRQAWTCEPGDHWLEVATLEAAIEAIPSGARVLLALGSQHIAPFATRNDVFFLVRMVDMPGEPLPLPNHRILTGKPSPDWLREKQLLEENRITHILCRNSGGTGAYGKIRAARELAVPVIIVQR